MTAVTCPSGHNMNPNAMRFRSLNYDTLGGTVLRNHIQLAREYELPPIHVPADRTGVVP